MGAEHDYQLEQLEQNIKDAKSVIQLKKDLDMLRKNPGFKNLILEEFFVKEGARVIQMKSSMQFQTDEKQQYLDNQIMGIGALQQFFVKIDAMYSQALNSLAADERTQAEMLEEG